jgi:hypothetical protein
MIWYSNINNTCNEDDVEQQGGDDHQGEEPHEKSHPVKGYLLLWSYANGPFQNVVSVPYVGS